MAPAGQLTALASVLFCSTRLRAFGGRRWRRPRRVRAIPGGRSARGRRVPGRPGSGWRRRRTQHGLQRIADRQPAAAGARAAGDGRRARPTGFAEAGIGPVGDLQRVVSSSASRIAASNWPGLRPISPRPTTMAPIGLGDRRVVEETLWPPSGPGRCRRGAASGG